MNRYYINLIFVYFVVLVCLPAVLAEQAGPALAQTVIYVDDDAPFGGDGQSWNTAYRFLQDAIESRSDAVEDAQGAGAERLEIRVAQGIYKPDRSETSPEGTGDREVSFHLTGNTSIRGGYLGHRYAGLGMPDPNAQDPNLYQTILSGDLAGNDVDVNDLSKLMEEPTRAENALHVMVVEGWQPLPDEEFTQEEIWFNVNVIEGLVITGGHALRVSNVQALEFQVGGGILLNAGYTDVKDCQFEKNVASG